MKQRYHSIDCGHVGMSESPIPPQNCEGCKQMLAEGIKPREPVTRDRHAAHIPGCATNGGTRPGSQCPKCSTKEPWAVQRYYEALMRADKRSGR